MVWVRVAHTVAGFSFTTTLATDGSANGPHTVDFRAGPLFTQWRAIVGPYFAKPPIVEHFTLLAKSS